MSAHVPIYKVITVGDGACGKTSMLMTYARDQFPDQYIPTVFDNYPKMVQLTNGKSVILDLWDTAGQEDYQRLRPIALTDAGLVIIAFSIDRPTSLSNVYEQWWPEVKHFCPLDTPIILVGLKSDLRNDPDTRDYLYQQGSTPVAYEEGRKMAASIGNVPYVECSALRNEGLDDVFQTVVYLLLKPSRRVRKSCIIL